MFDNNPKDSSKKDDSNSNSHISMSEVQEYQPTRKFNLSELWDDSHDSGSDEEHPAPLQDDSQAGEPNPALMVDPFDEPFDYPESMPFSIPVNAKFIPKGLVKDGDVNTLKVMFMLANQPQEDEATSNVVADNPAHNAASLGDVPPTQVSIVDISDQDSAQEIGSDEDIRALEEMFGLADNQPQQAQAASNEVVNSFNQEATPQSQQDMDAPRVYDMDDGIILDSLGKYCNIKSLKPSKAGEIKSAVKGFCSYLRNNPNSGGIKDPKPQDVLNYIRSLRSSDDETRPIEFKNAQDILSYLKFFFKFLKGLDLPYDDAMESLTTRDLHIMYGEGNNQNNPQPDQVQEIANEVVNSVNHEEEIPQPQQVGAEPIAAASNEVVNSVNHEEVIPQPQQVQAEPIAAASNEVVNSVNHEEIPQPQQTQAEPSAATSNEVVNNSIPNWVRPAVFGNVPPPPMFMAIPNMDNLNMGANNPVNAAAAPLPQQVIHVPQDRPRLSSQQAQMAEVRKRIRQGQYVPQVPRFSRVHMAQSAPNAMSTPQQQLIMKEYLMQQVRLMQQAGQLQQVVPNQPRQVVLQQLIQQIEQAQSVKDLNKIRKNLAIHCDIDDEIVFEFLKKYGSIQSMEQDTISSIKSNAQSFCAYLRNTPNSGGIQNPTPQDVLEYIASLRSEEDSTKPIKFKTAKPILSNLKSFFEFLKDIGVYNNNITKGLTDGNLYIMYRHETSPVCKRRKDFWKVMKQYPNHTLDLRLFEQYIDNINVKAPIVKKALLKFKNYLANKGILQPSPDDVTMFFVKNPSLLKNCAYIQEFTKNLKMFFKQTSETTAPNGQILYPDIGGYLDSSYWLDKLLKKLGDPDFELFEPINDIVNDMMECLGLKEPEEDSLD